MEYRVEFANYASDKIGEELTNEVMTLEDARTWVAEHPRVEYVILQRESGRRGALWSILPSDSDEKPTVVSREHSRHSVTRDRRGRSTSR